MVNLYNQISLSDTFLECKNTYQNDKPKFLELLTQNLDLASLIPQTFYWSYNKTLGRDRKYSLPSMLAALILQKSLVFLPFRYSDCFLSYAVKLVSSAVSMIFPTTLSSQGSNRILFPT